MKKRVASEILEDIYEHNKSDRIKIDVLVETAEHGGFGLAIFILSLILIIPTPPPISSIAGSLLLVFSIQMAVGMRRLWVPSFIGNMSIKRSILATMIHKTSPHIRKLEGLTRTRLLFAETAIGKRLIGLFMTILSVALLVPIPFINCIFGFSLLLISFGMLSRDGVIIIGGILAGILALVVFGFILAMGKAIIYEIFNI